MRWREIIESVRPWFDRYIREMTLATAACSLSPYVTSDNYNIDQLTNRHDGNRLEMHEPFYFLTFKCIILMILTENGQVPYWDKQQPANIKTDLI